MSARLFLYQNHMAFWSQTSSFSFERDFRNCRPYQWRHIKNPDSILLNEVYLQKQLFCNWTRKISTCCRRMGNALKMFIFYIMVILLSVLTPRLKSIKWKRKRRDLSYFHDFFFMWTMPPKSNTYVPTPRENIPLISFWECLLCKFILFSFCPIISLTSSEVIATTEFVLSRTSVKWCYSIFQLLIDVVSVWNRSKYCRQLLQNEFYF